MVGRGGQRIFFGKGVDARVTEKATEKQRRFAEAYRETGDAAEAARRTGYLPGHAERTLRSAGVQKCLKEMDAVDGPDVATGREVLAYLTDVLRGEDAGAATPRMKAAELLGKRLGVFNEAAPEAMPPVILDDIPRPEGGEDSAGENSPGG